MRIDEAKSGLIGKRLAGLRQLIQNPYNCMGES
jgi:hypothetical protein